MYADVKGIPDDTLSFVTLDGVSDCLSIDYSKAVNIPGFRTTEGGFTFEAKVRIPVSASGLRAIASVYDTDSGYEPWRLLYDASTNTMVGRMCNSDGSYESVTSSALMPGGIYSSRLSWAPGEQITLQIDGSTYESSLSVEGLKSITAGSLTIGARDGSNHYNDRIYYGVLADGSQQLTVSATSCRDAGGALENIISEWPLSFDGSDLQGNNDLDETSLSWSGGDYSVQTEERNPAHSLRSVLLQFSELQSCDMSEETFIAAASLSHDRGYDATASFGAAIPDRQFQIESSTDQWSLLQSICAGFNHALVISRSGKIGLRSLDVSTTGEADLVTYREKDGDFTPEGLRVNLKPVELSNEVRAQFRQVHAVESGFEKYLKGYNQVSKETFGVREEIRTNRIGQASVLVKDVLGREMQLQSGRMRSVRWEVPGLYGLQAGSDIGDRVKLTHRTGPGNWQNQQVLLSGVEVDLFEGVVSLEGLCIGDGFSVGSIAFSEEISETITADLDTYVSSGNPYQCFGNLDHYFHGEYGPTSHIKYRCALRFDLSSVHAAGGTIRSASLQLVVELSHDAKSINIRELKETTWGESSFWNAFAGNGTGSAWSESNIGTTNLTDTVGGGNGFKTFVFNDDGIAYLNSILGNGNKAHLTHQPMTWMFEIAEEYYRFASRSGDMSKRPKLTVVFTT
jgi:hypothetical protein